jgi:hypothetical protein
MDPLIEKLLIAHLLYSDGMEYPVAHKSTDAAEDR